MGSPTKENAGPAVKDGTMAIQGKDSLVGEGGHAAFFCSCGGEPGRMVEHSRVVADIARRGAFAPHTIQRRHDLLRPAPGWRRWREILTGCQLGWERCVWCSFGCTATNWNGFANRPSESPEPLARLGIQHGAAGPVS